jgi:hypothetical protein
MENSDSCDRCDTFDSYCANWAWGGYAAGAEGRAGLGARTGRTSRTAHRWNGRWIQRWPGGPEPVRALMTVWRLHKFHAVARHRYQVAKVLRVQLLRSSGQLKPVSKRTAYLPVEAHPALAVRVRQNVNTTSGAVKGVPYQQYTVLVVTGDPLGHSHLAGA